MLRAVATLAILACASGAVGATQTAEPKPAQEAAKPKLICQKIVPIGSIMAKKFCMTKEEWKSFGDITRANADALLEKRGAGTCDIKCPGAP